MTFLFRCALLSLVLATAAGAQTTAPASYPIPNPLVDAVLTAPDATMLSGRVTTGGTATIVMSRRDRELVSGLIETELYVTRNSDGRHQAPPLIGDRP